MNGEREREREEGIRFVSAWMSHGSSSCLLGKLSLEPVLPGNPLEPGQSV